MCKLQCRSRFAATWRRLATVSAAATLIACGAANALSAGAVSDQPPAAGDAPPASDTPPASDPPPATPVPSSADAGQAQSDAGWTTLFDGQTLDGWVQRGGRAKFSVQRGELVGATRLGTADSFLCTEAQFANFELELEFKVDPRINAGVQFRSHSDPAYEAGAVYGYQADIDPTERSWTGGIYDQARRGWLVSLEKRPDARAAFKPEQWNTLRIRADGPHIATWINGVPAAELEDDRTASGFIALQVHRTDLAESREVRWRNIRLRSIEN